MDILPIEVMREKGARTIIAVDVSTREETALANYGDELSGWWLLWRKLNPFLTMPKVRVLHKRIACVFCSVHLPRGVCTHARAASCGLLACLPARTSTHRKRE